MGRRDDAQTPPTPRATATRSEKGKKSNRPRHQQSGGWVDGVGGSVWGAQSGAGYVAVKVAQRREANLKFPASPTRQLLTAPDRSTAT